MCTIKTDRSGSKGFTLIEIAVVLIILGLLLAGGAKAYSTYMQELRAENTSVRTRIINDAIGDFRTSFGRYPCPASMTLQYGALAYGHETDCEDFTVTPGNCGGGICTEVSFRSIGFLSGGSLITDTPWVRSGFVPFRALNIPEDFAYDGYGHRIKYVVTQHLAVDDDFQPGTGGIEILNDQNVTILNPASSAHFVLISHGKDGIGGYTRAGVQTPCTLGLMESDNCNQPSVNAQYRLSLATTANNAGQFDDKLFYFTMQDAPLWQLSEADNIDIHQKLPGSVAVSVNSSDVITDEAEIAGAVRTRDNLMTNNLCAFDEVSDCFPSSLIAGQIDGVDDLVCPPGQFMTGIQFASAVCTDEIFIKCPGADAMTGIDADGQPICTSPPESCPSQDVGICGETRVLPPTPDGGTATVTAGDNGESRYRCNGTSWQLIFDQSDPDDCVCTPRNQTRNNDCGAGFSGTIGQERDYVCPDAYWTSWRDLPGNSFADNCTCVATTQQRNRSCQSGYDGNIRQERSNSCPDGTWGPWTEISNTCVCNPRRSTRNRSCSGGLSGSYQQERFFECPAANWTNWQDVPGNGPDENCVCTPRQDERPRTCPSGYTGTYYEIRDFECPSASWTGWREDPSRSQASECEREPIRTCEWSPASSGNYNQSFALGSPVNSSCECDSGTGACHTRNGPTSFTNYTVCTCD